MAEAEQKLLQDMDFVKSKIVEMDKELHKLREDFEDTHLTEEDRKALAEALEDARQGRTIPLSEVKKKFGF